MTTATDPTIDLTLDGLDEPVSTCLCPTVDTTGSRATAVPRELVHRAATAEVFLTGMCQPGADRFHITAQLPRAHSFFVPVGGGHYDPMLVCETIRQVGAFIAHSAYGVPLGHQFLLSRLDYETFPEHLGIGDTPADVDLDVTCSEIRHRAGRLQSLCYSVVMRLGEHVIATGHVGYSVTSPAVYRRLRAEQISRTPRPSLPARPVRPYEVGRNRLFDVVLASAAPIPGREVMATTARNTVEEPNPGTSADEVHGEGMRWRLRYDTRHPILFDHPGDHVPGMVLLEAARQAAIALTPVPESVVPPPDDTPPGSYLLPTAVRSTYQRYAEFDEPLWISAVRVGPTRVRVTGLQNGETVFDALMDTAWA
ncbi:ScbA/BarX family gamma-butyrolactone biosynthesis protein [Streptomyces sp. BI20]|uniref:ScbA/BarX family gamma-butyrolactone biosynthesis protein n=1 Tax=Streptomyces sp. BI20 TaxID=3403460 RepID=UPI003C728E49